MTDEKAKHFSTGKLGIDQIPDFVLAELGLVYSYGEIKYGRDNWMSGTEWHEFIGSAKRHFAYWCLGQDEDSESGINHLSHAIWNLIALRYYQKTGGGVDDRPFDARLHAGMDEPITDADDILTKLADVQARANAWKESHA